MKTLVAALALAVASLTCSSDQEDAPDADGGGSVICPTWFAPGVMVEVRDAATGLPGACEAAGKAESGGMIQTLPPGPSCQDYPDSLYMNGIDRAGTYTLTIERPGYQPWVVGGIDVVIGVCGLVTVHLRADLQPL